MAVRPAGERIYRLTEAGAAALRKGAAAGLEQHQRKVLQLIQGDTHIDVIRGWLRHYPNEKLDQWLARLESAGLVRSAGADETHDLDFTGSFSGFQAPDVSLTDTDAMRLAAATREAAAALAARGAYLATDRLQNRAPSAKSAGEITVLIVEDDPDQAALAERRLGPAGYRVQTVGTMRGMIEYLRANPRPDVMLLDVGLPDGDGFDILVSIRRHPKLALLPVIMLTVLGEPKDIRKGLQLGADGYIPKPYSKTMLADAISAVLKHA
jgi:CheY-like chemotaxis protein